VTRINIRQLVNHCSANQRIGGPWDLIIKISVARRKNQKGVPMLLKPLTFKE